MNTRPTTSAWYKLVVEKQLKRHFGTSWLNKLTAIHITQLYALLEKAGESARNRQMAGTVLYGALKHAVRMKLISHNPCEDVTRPKVLKKEMRAYDPEQVQKFLETALGDRLYALYVVAVDTGMRQGELFGLQWPDIDFDGCTIQVQRTLEEL